MTQKWESQSTSQAELQVMIMVVVIIMNQLYCGLGNRRNYKTKMVDNT